MVQRTQIRGTHDCVIDRVRKSNSTKLVHALSRTFKRMSIRHQVESGAPFNADRDLRMGMIIERGRLRYATCGIGVSQQSDTARRHVCRPKSGGPHACRQR